MNAVVLGPQIGVVALVLLLGVATKGQLDESTSAVVRKFQDSLKLILAAYVLCWVPPPSICPHRIELTHVFGPQWE